MAFGSLTNRIFLSTTLMVVLSIGLAIFVVNVSVTRHAEEALQRELSDAATLVERDRDLLFEQLALEARLIADLPKLKAAVEVNHPPTLRPIAEDYRTQIGSDVFVVTNATGSVLAQLGNVDLPGRVADLAPVSDALTGLAASSFWPRGGGPVQVLAVPIWIDETHPELLGTLSVGFNLDESLATRFKQLTASEIAFLVNGAVEVSTLPAEYSPTLADALRDADEAVVWLGGEEYVAITRSLAAGGGRRANAAFSADERPAPTAVILQSRTEQLALLGSLQAALVGTGLVAVLLATLISYGVARTVTQPVGAIIATMRELSATGDLTAKIQLTARGWHDEETRLLANTFNSMTGSIARFQREAAQRERLSALGRLSTVVAHEIRNPLLIIKAALRTLTRQAALSPEATHAARDIGEEVDRLNRIVGEVLDFARPVRFELSPVDVNALCHEAIAAADADGEAPSIRARLAPAIAPLVTDRERLRLTLVNVLANARHSVRERGGPGPAETPPADQPPGSAADVELCTEDAGDAVVITVRDRGTGVAPENIPRLFDPYFTTKRTGSGLGLAIAKNVVEGLGGTIAISSRLGHGTELRIELPRRAERAESTS